MMRQQDGGGSAWEIAWAVEFPSILMFLCSVTLAIACIFPFDSIGVGQLGKW